MSAPRNFRGATYQIRVERNGSGDKVTLKVDSNLNVGNLVPIAAPGKKVNIEVSIG